MNSTPQEDDSRTLFSLLRELPSLIQELVRAEVEQLKREMARKIKNVGLGTLLVVVALSLGFFLLGTLTAAAILGLAEVLPAWAAALIVSGILLLLAVLLGALGVARLKKASPLLPTETFDSIVQDARAFKRKGRRDRG